MGELADGNHTFRVRARDPAGNTTFAGVSFTVDATPPETQIDSVTVNHARGKATVKFSGSDPPPATGAITFECSLDGAAFAPCISPTIYKGLATGLHNVAVRAVDAAGNVDPTPASQDFSI